MRLPYRGKGKGRGLQKAAGGKTVEEMIRELRQKNASAGN